MSHSIFGTRPRDFNRAAHQAPEVDGNTTILGTDLLAVDGLRPGDLVRCRVVDTDGIDLFARAVEMIGPVPGPTTASRRPMAVRS